MNILILGATSDIAAATAQALARKGGTRFLLAARDLAATQRIADDLATRYQVAAEVTAYDALDWQGHADWVAALDPMPDVVVVAVGLLGDQDRAQSEPQHALHIMQATYTGLVSTLEPLAQRMLERGSGKIGIMGSVAGLRGRQSNYIYGSAKAALHAYASGLRNRMSAHGVHVMTALIGWVDTRMLVGQELPEVLVAAPDQVAEKFVASLLKERNVVYLPWFWRWIMLIIRSIPEVLFKRLKL